MRTLNIDTPRTPDRWPNPGWPGCPGGRRFYQASQLLSENNDLLQEKIKALPPSPKSRRAHQDALALQTLVRATDRCSAALKGLQEDDQVQAPEYIHALAQTITSDEIIGMAITTQPAPDQRSFTLTCLSRAKHWTGLNPLLPMLEGLQAVVFLNPSGRPHTVIAFPKQWANPCEQPNLLFPEDYTLQSRQETSTLERVLAYHQAQIHRLDICQINDIELELPEEEEIPLHNGPPETWLN